jgi:ferredoxin
VLDWGVCPVRVVVDLTRCQGYGQCAFLAPDVFEMHGREALMYDPEPGDAQRDHVLRAVAACPVQALHIDMVDARKVAWRAAVPEPVEPSAPAEPAEPAATARMAAAGGGGSRLTGRIVIVGASLAGLRAAAVLRRDGFTGSLTLIGDEPYEPYDRPPLSKQVLTGRVPAERTTLPSRGDLNAEWLRGQPATGLDLAGKRVFLAGRGEVPSTTC